eukprot:gb/GECH01010035.1/.p1 GENE.gb/GECH01010035.1/~~gb/GECH01010035.1/.p1  ORF type:complete len:801 (+),score=133.67 gb/GECH01010035.1/:1-2403(+)
MLNLAEGSRNQSTVSLNVGGVIHKTTISTLINNKHEPDSMFTAMFGRNQMFELQKDESGNIFIDRDGRHFHLLLNYLRSGKLLVPSDQDNVMELLIEAEYYQLSGAISILRQYLNMPFQLSQSQPTVATPSSTTTGTSSPFHPSSATGSIDSGTNTSPHQPSPSVLSQNALGPTSTLILDSDFDNPYREELIKKEEEALIGAHRAAYPNSECIIVCKKPKPCYRQHSSFSSSSQQTATLRHTTPVSMDQEDMDTDQTESGDISGSNSSHISSTNNTSATPERLQPNIFEPEVTRGEEYSYNSEFSSDLSTTPTCHKFHSIAEAVRYINRPETSAKYIYICSGEYDEAKPIKIKKDGVQIQGSRRGEVKIRRSTGSVVQIEANDVKIQNITVCAEINIHAFGMEIMDGSNGATIDSCSITSASGRACLSVGPNAANTTIQNNIISFGNDIGLLFNEKSSGRIEGNRIFCNKRANLWIETDSHPYIFNNDIFGGRHAAGVWLKQNTRCTVEYNRIYCNDCTNVVVDPLSNPTIRRNVVYGGKENGVFIKERAGGTYEENDIHHNLHPNIALAPGATAIVRKNKIWDGNDCGIWFNGASGTITENDIFGHRFPNITMESGSTPSVSKNHIHSGRDCGIWIKKDVDANIEANEIYGHKRTNIVVEGQASPTVKGNKIYSGKENGIYVKEHAGGIYDSNEIYLNAYPNIAVANEATPTVTNNLIFGSVDCGVWIKTGARGVYESNIIFDNQCSGVLVDTKSAPELRNNEIKGNDQGAVISKDSNAVIERNNIYDNSRDELKVVTS